MDVPKDTAKGTPPLATESKSVSLLGRLTNGFDLQVFLPIGALLGGTLALVAGLIYVSAIDSHIRWQVFSLLCMFSFASVTIGGLVGFIFGIPRTVESSPTAGHNARTTAPNTNLEQISDWLTKLLVGATLTQLGNIPSAATALFSGMADAMGTGASGKAFAGGLVIYSTGVGFVTVWTGARKFLGAELEPEIG